MGSFSVHLKSERGIIIAEHRGSWTYEEGNELVEKVIRLARRSKVQKAIFDHRRLKVNFSTLESFERGKYILLSEAPNYLQKVALVYSARNTETIDGYRFFEAVLRNRGVNIRIFADKMQEAVIWLSGDSHRAESA